jgi:class 3 adenylate cyclase/pimeloyl-ACP methyl ester carboxylesterase
VTRETKYAKSGDISIAYRVLSDGPLTAVYTPPGMGTIEFFEEIPEATRYFDRLASFCRLIVFDKRGMGMSDRVAVGTIEERMDDIRAVMDATDTERAALIGLSEGGPMSMLFAATYPERVSALVLYGTFARGAIPQEQREENLRMIDRYWGQGLSFGEMFKHLPPDEARAAGARAERMTATPGAFKALAQMNWEIDVTHALPAISAPTLVLHKTLDDRVDIRAGRYIARKIPGAVLKELPGTQHVPEIGEWKEMLDEIEEFLTGTRSSPVPDRVLATVLFTDIVDSTKRASELGDQRWRELITEHDAISHRQVERFRGRMIKGTGDGVLATFDGPARGVLCARAIHDGVRNLGIEVRSGLHTGECELIGDDVGGIAVHTAQRVSSLAGPGETLVSRTVTDLVAGSGLEFEDRGEHELKGVPGSWQLYLVR